ncbi:MAG: RidA family protein [Candidatus Methylomirabilia bacterium]
MAIKVLIPKVLGRPLGMYSHGVVAPGGELVVVAGQVGMDGAGRVAGADVGSQTKQALENIRAVLGNAGCSIRDVVRLQTFLTRADDIEGFMQARREVFPQYFPDGVYPPNTLVVISQLVRPELLVEIEAMAVKPTRPGQGVGPQAGAAAKKARAVTRKGRVAARKRRPAGRRR